MKIFNRLMMLGVAAMFCLGGCVQIASIPYTAHAGDTVVLGLGGIKRNWQGETPKNLQVSITDSASNTFALTADIKFQAYPDYRSSLNISALNGGDGYKVLPYDGGWFIAVNLSDSATGNPLALAAGPATISVTAANFVEVLDDQQQPIANEGNLTQIPLEIVAGPPSPVNSSVQFTPYENRGSNFLIHPTGTTASTVGGAYYVINYASDASFGAVKPMVFPVAHNPFIKLDYEIKDNGNGSGSYRIYVYNRAGFVAATPRQSKQGGLEDLGIHLDYFEQEADVATVKANFTLDEAQSYFVDSNGNKVTALQPEMVHASDL